MFVFKALNGLAPSYLSELLVVRDHALTSTNQLLLDVPKSKRWGDRAFSVAAPRLWNKLPAELRFLTEIQAKDASFQGGFYFIFLPVVKHFGSPKGRYKGLNKLQQQQQQNVLQTTVMLIQVFCCST